MYTYGMSTPKMSQEELEAMPVSILVKLIMNQQETIETLTRHIDELTEQIRLMNQRSFGRKTESSQFVQQLQFDLGLNEAEEISDEKAADPVLDEAAPKKKKAKGKKQEDWQKITNHRDEYLELTEDELNKQYGKGKWKRLSEELIYKLEHRPASFEAVTYHIAVYAKDDNQTIVRAPKQAEMFPKSIATPSLVSSIITAKYVNAIPLYRLEAAYAQNDIHISRAVMANWVIRAYDQYLRYVCEALKQEMTKQRILHADETPFEVIRDGREAGSKSYMWVYRTNAKIPGHKVILYQYCPTRGHENPKNYLKDFKGTLVTDGYGAYHKLEKEDPAKFKVAGCWVHLKRKFSTIVKANGRKYNNPIATEAVRRIQRIYHEEHLIQDLPPEEHLQKRQEKIKPLVDEFFAWVKDKSAAESTDKSSETGKSLQYALNQEKYLRVFLEDAQVPLDNNAAEIAIRPFTVGRKNWVLIDTPRGAEASAGIYSIVETAKANGLKLYPYFTYLLEELPKIINEGCTTIPDRLLPWSEEVHQKLGM